MSSSDFFRKFQPLFESKEEDAASKKRADKRAAEEEAWAKSKGTPKKDVKEGWSDENPDDDKSDWAEREQCKADDKRKADKEDAACKALDKAKKPKNTKESAGEFFRRYADIITEAESDDEEDPDVAAADKVKGKDGKTQKDAEKGKKLPPWLDKKDKEDEDKGAKKAKKEDL
jgi:hypothetical protein